MTDLEFIPYRSLTNHYREKEIGEWLELLPELATEMYVATEKIHGANIQLIFNPGEEMQVASRNRVLPDDENFFNARQVLEGEELSELCIAVRNYARQVDKTVRLYGELFGPGINKGVDYGDEKRILFFDAMHGPKLLSWDGFDAWMQSIDFQDLTVPVIYYTDTLEEALTRDYYKETRLGSGIMEGVVIKTVLRTYWTDRSIFIIKRKNDEFKENASAKKVVVIDEDVATMHTLFVDYVNEMRVQSVFSKEGVIDNKKDMGRYIRLILDDAIADFTADYDEVTELDAPQRKQVFNVGSTVAKMLLAHL